MSNPYTKDKEQGSKGMSDYASSALHEGEDKIRDFMSDADHKIKEGEEQLRRIIKNVDKKLHDNPWPIVGGVAAACLLLGFVMGQSRTRN